jgi:DNA-binding GntR family transcriptional regulator
MPETALPRSKSKSSEIFAALHERILSSFYPPSSRMPAEIVLASEFNVSIATIRSALDELVFRRLIFRKQGAGTFVASQVHIPNLLNQTIDWSAVIEGGGAQAGILYHHSAIVEANPVQIEALHLENDFRVYKMRKTFTADGNVVILVTDMIPAALLSPRYLNIALDDPTVTEPYLPFLHRATGITPYTVLSNLKVATAATSGLDDHQPDLPVLVMEEVITSRDETPLSWGVAHYPGDHMEFNIRRTIPPDALV